MSELISKVYSFDQENCGFILNTGEIVVLQNLHPDPVNNFAISDEDILNYGLENILAFWHSHLNNDTNLSTNDYKAFLNFPDHYHIIFCYTDFTVYTVRNNLVIRLDHASNSEFSSRFATLVSS